MGMREDYEEAVRLAKSGDLEGAQALLVTIDHPKAEKLLQRVNSAIMARHPSQSNVSAPANTSPNIDGNSLVPVLPNLGLAPALRNFWGFILLCSIAWLVVGIFAVWYASSSTSSEMASLSYDTTEYVAGMLGVGIGASFLLTIVLCTGMPIFLTSLFLYWRNDVAIRQRIQEAVVENRHRAQLASATGQRFKAPETMFVSRHGVYMSIVAITLILLIILWLTGVVSDDNNWSNNSNPLPTLIPSKTPLPTVRPTRTVMVDAPTVTPRVSPRDLIATVSPPDDGEWLYDRSVSTLDDAVTHFIVLESENKVRSIASSYPMYLAIGCSDNDYVMGIISEVLFFDGITNDTPNVRVRFGSGGIQTKRSYITDDFTGLAFLPNQSLSIIQRMLEVDSFVIEVPLLDGNKELEYDIRGLREAIKPLENQCGDI